MVQESNKPTHHTPPNERETMSDDPLGMQEPSDYPQEEFTVPMVAIAARYLKMLDDPNQKRDGRMMEFMIAELAKCETRLKSYRVDAVAVVATINSQLHATNEQLTRERLKSQVLTEALLARDVK